MLDKSVPYFDVLMRRRAGAPIAQFALPEGFSFCLYEPGDEKAWAKIETSVLEFSDELDALLYCQREFLAYLPEFQRRGMFIIAPGGEKVATGTAWWGYSGVRRDPWLHWISVKPEYQGLGLGKAIVSRVTRLMLEIEGDRDFYLHTQTWSHKAIEIYQRLGYEIISDRDIAKYSNENYDKAIEVLNSVKLRDGRK